ncbi:MAG: hypothetical protein IJ695_06545 [Butyrivibrio sp.]|nr:hypothetical protein [Butyrivibrio sp.]
MAIKKKLAEAVKPVATIKTPVAEEETTVVETAKEETRKEETKKAAKAEKKAASKKDETKKAAKAEKKATAKKEETKKEAPAKKEASARKAASESAVKANIVLEYVDGRQIPYDKIVEDSKNNYQYEMGGDVNEIKKLSVYVKPEENAAYYVVNDKVQGRIGL